MMANICSIEGCRLGIYRPEETNIKDVYADNDKCILHCDKSHRMKCNRSTNMEVEFKEALKKHAEVFSKDKTHLTLCGIHFPENYEKWEPAYEYTSILKQYQLIQFMKCHFYTGELKLDNVAVLFDQCSFHSYWDLENYYPFITVDDHNYERLPHIYQQCTFEGAVTNGLAKQLDHTQFLNCNFEKALEIGTCIIKEPLFAVNATIDISPKESEQKIKSLKFTDCEFQSVLEINNCEIFENIELENCKCKSTFDFQNNDIKGDLLIEGCHFDKTADLSESDFKGGVNIGNTVFNAVSIFEGCQFNSSKCITNFGHVSFKEQVIFRNAKFLAGLDLSTANFYASANFLGSEIEKGFPKNKKTNRETFRLIKHNFDSIGNQLEANKYFAEEMRKKKEELSETKSSCSEKLVFFLNDKISKFGQSYIRPITLLVASMLLFYLVTTPSILEYLKLIPYLPSVVHFLNDVFKQVPILSHVLGAKADDSLTFIRLVSYIWYSVLVWQIIVAVKRHVRR
ncbi:pentapeptide repeat-containing protein [Cysteiniphilum halobium]|uniref:pentapeptide repeat-containing protein n=1 Tax=Cysteiniphilum halobium TaxID=2219059 RepID=UPI003F843D24